MKRTTRSFLASAAIAILLPAMIALASDFDLTWHTIDGGGGTSASATHELSGTIGQPDAGVMTGTPGSGFTLTGGFWAGAAVKDDPTDPTPPCPGDLTGSGTVGVPDLLQLLSAWGACPAPPGTCPADLTNSGTVGVPDLLQLLSNWGTCPP